MTKLYKKNGAVFIPAGITFEEVEKLKDDNKIMVDNYSKMKQNFYDNFTKAKELLTRFVMASVYFNGKETDLIKEAEQFLKRSKWIE